MENVAKHLEISLQGEHLENNSPQDLAKAREVLEIAKAQDQIKKEFGYKEVRLYDQFNTVILKKCST